MKLKNTLILSAVIFGGYKILKNATKLQELKIEELEAEIAKLKTVITLMRLKVIDKANNRIRVEVKLYDLDGVNFKTFEYSELGNNVAIDFYVLQLNDYYIAFPYKMFTNLVEPENGKNIVGYYDYSSFPQIYHSIDNTSRFDEQVKFLFQKIKVNDLDDLNIFGNAVMPSVQWGVDVGDTFKIELHTKGGLELIKE